MNRATFAQHTENLGNLVALVDALKNHDALVKAHKEAQKALALTDEELKKAEDLRELVAKNEALLEKIGQERVSADRAKAESKSNLEELENQKRSLRQSQDIHRADVEKHNAAMARAEEFRKKAEAETNAAAKAKADYEAKLHKLNDREKALDLRAEKILLREKASEL